MTALQKAKKLNPMLEEDSIIKYGCPDRYGVGKVPVFCNRGTNKDINKKHCKICWGQEAN